MGNSLQGQVAVVTGAAHGMGQAIAEVYAKEGATLGLLDNQEAALQQVADDIASQGVKAATQVVDVRDNTAVEDALAYFRTNLGPIDIAVNSAGLGIYKVFDDLTEEDWDTTFDVNVKGTFHVCRHVAKEMASRESGLIINIASLAAKIRGFERGTCYLASKYAVLGFSRCLAVELRPKGVRVCCLSPGSTDTHFRGSPTGNPNWMSADDVASVALYVAAQPEKTAVHEIVFSNLSEAW